MNKGKSAEQYVEHFANTAYLKHWCYPNPIDENGSGKEICDLLILFQFTCIIISIKNYEFNGNIERFQKKVIEKSTKQLYGAERKLFHSSEVYIKHPEKGIEKFEPEKYKNIIRITINMGELYEFYTLGDIKEGKSFINIIHRDSFSQIIRELDTIPDLINYLNERENLLMTQYPIIIEGSELDLLATFMLNKRSFPTDFYKNEDGLKLNLRGTWINYDNQNKHVKDRREADKQSYIIDQLVGRDILRQKWGSELASELMNFNRIDRRFIAQSLYDLVEKYKHNNESFARRSFELNGILILLISYPIGTLKKDIDRFIDDAGGIYMYKHNYQYEKIIILGTTYDLSESKYGLVVRTNDQNENGEKYLEELCKEYGWFQNITTTKVEFKEFPNEPN